MGIFVGWGNRNTERSVLSCLVENYMVDCWQKLFAEANRRNLIERWKLGEEKKDLHAKLKSVQDKLAALA